MVPIKNQERKKPSQSPKANSALTSQQQPPASCLPCLAGPRILCFLSYDCVTNQRAWIPAPDRFQQGPKLPHSSKSLTSIYMATVWKTTLAKQRNKVGHSRFPLEGATELKKSTAGEQQKIKTKFYSLDKTVIYSQDHLKSNVRHEQWQRKEDQIDSFPRLFHFSEQTSWKTLYHLRWSRVTRASFLKRTLLPETIAPVPWNSF